VGPGLEDGMAGISRRSAPRCAGGVVREEKSGKEKSGQEGWIARCSRDHREETAEKRATLCAKWPSDDGVSERMIASSPPNVDRRPLTAGFKWQGC
jgi:hypothetical protein